MPHSPSRALRRRILRGLLPVCLLPALLAPASALASVRGSSSDGDPQTRVARTAELAVDASQGWRGTVSFGRQGQVDGMRRVWRPAPVHLRLEREDCDVAGCWRTVISTPLDPAVTVSAQVPAGLPGAGIAARLVPVSIDRFLGTVLMSRTTTALVVTVAVESHGPTREERNSWSDDRVRRETTLRRVNASGLLELRWWDTTGAPAPIEMTVSGTVSVRRTVVTTVSKAASRQA